MTVMSDEQARAVHDIAIKGLADLVHEHPEIREIDVDLLMAIFDAGREVGIRSFVEVLA